MKIKLGQLVNSQTALQDLASKQLLAKNAFRLKRALMAAEEPLKVYVAVRDDLIKKYGETIGELVQIKPNTPGMKSFNEEIAPMLDNEIELAIDKLPFETIADVKISADNLFLLDWLIDEPKPDAPTTP